jgi:hypothetical protein
MGLEQLIQTVNVVEAITISATDLKDLDLPDKDRSILGGAIAGNCTHLITGDFKHFGPHYGTHWQGFSFSPPPNREGTDAGQGLSLVFQDPSRRNQQ